MTDQRTMCLRTFAATQVDAFGALEVLWAKGFRDTEVVIAQGKDDQQALKMAIQVDIGQSIELINWLIHSVMKREMGPMELMEAAIRGEEGQEHMVTMTMPVFVGASVGQASGALVRASIEHIELKGLWRAKLLEGGVETKQLVGQDHRPTDKET